MGKRRGARPFDERPVYSTTGSWRPSACFPIDSFLAVDCHDCPLVFAPLVFAAFLAEALRSAGVRCWAAVRACLERAAGEAAVWPSFFIPFSRARLRTGSTGS